MTISTAYAAAANVNATLNGSTAPGNYTDQSPTTWYPNNVGAWLNNGSGGAVYTDFNNSGNYAQAVFNSKTTNTDSEAICLYNFAANWSTSITSGATISACSGVISRVGGTSTTHGSYYDLCVQLVIYNGSDLTSGLIGSNQAAASAAWPNNASPTSNFATASYTFSAPTYSQATNSNFGVAFGVDGSKTTNTLSAYVNYVQLSVTWTASSPPDAPSALALSYISPTSLGATWTNPSGTLTDNKIQISTDNATWTTIDIGSVVTSYTFTGLTPNTLYYVQVAAVNSSGTSSYSQANACYTAPTTTLTATLSPSSDGTIIGWTKQGGLSTATATLTDGSNSTYMQAPAAEADAMNLNLPAVPANLITMTQYVVNATMQSTSGAHLLPPITGIGPSGVALNESAGTFTNITTSFANYTATFVMNYLNGGTYTPTSLASLILSFQPGDSTGDLQISEASVTITYLVPAPSAPIPLGAPMGSGACPYGYTNQMRRNRVEGVRFRSGYGYR